MTRRRFGVLVLSVSLLLAAAGAPSVASAKSLQFSGSVVGIDGKAKTITVRNGSDTRVFSTAGLSDLKVRKGDRVSVDYRLAAWKIKRK